MSGLTIDGLTVRYGTLAAVDRLSLTIERGRTYALVGPSGCGKSTLLRAVAGLVEPDAGSITWAGEDLLARPVHRRDVGLMFQDHALFTHRSVADNVGFGLKMRGVDARSRSRRVERLLDMVGLDGFGRRSVDSLSGGEAQRVALARALAPEPQLLLLDEPLASLDRARRVELNDELVRLLDDLDQTAIYVTHDQEEAFAVADELGVMYAGRLLRSGTPSEVWRDPRSETVARFVGHETMIERNGHRYAVRDDAVQLVPVGAGGAIEGVVTAVAFRGDRHRLAVAAGGVTFTTHTVDPVAIGTAVAVQIDEARLADLGPVQAPPGGRR